MLTALGRLFGAPRASPSTYARVKADDATPFGSEAGSSAGGANPSRAVIEGTVPSAPFSPRSLICETSIQSGVEPPHSKERHHCNSSPGHMHIIFRRGSLAIWR